MSKEKTDQDTGTNGGGETAENAAVPADNNKRLHALEASVVVLAAVLADHGIETGQGDETEVDGAVRLIRTLEAELGELREAVKAGAEDLKKLQAEIDKAKVAGRQTPTAKAKSSRARKFGAGTPAKPFATDRDAVTAAMEAGDVKLELVFSNGAEEIIELNPLEFYPAAFRRVQGDRYKLNEAVLVKGARDGTRVRGYALVLDGKQIAYEALPEPVPLPAGQERKFEIIF